MLVIAAAHRPRILLAPHRAKLLRYTRHQAMLIYANAYDHLVTLGRVLGGDGAMPLFSDASLSRVVCAREDHDQVHRLRRRIA